MTENIHWKRTHCSRMDHGGCSLLVGVQGNRIVEIKGDPGGFLNKGYVCPKGLASADRLTHPGRLLHPMKRKGRRGQGLWERITWSEAIECLADRLNGVKKASGAKAVAFCQGMPKGLELFGLVRLANLFGSPNVVGVQDVCHAPREVSGIHTCGFYPVADLHHPSRVIMLWASNPMSTNEEGQICTLLLNRIKEGTEIIVIDPRKTELAERAKYWLQPRPGSDHLLALAFLNVIIEDGLFDKDFVDKWTHGFDALSAHVKSCSPEETADITWVPASIVREAARCYATAHPAAIQWGNPLEQTIHAYDAARALLCLMAVCGNLDEAGGNIHAVDPDVLGLGGFVRSDLLPSKPKEMVHAHYKTIPKLMTVPPAYFRKAVLDETPYPIRAAYLQGTNPLLAYAGSCMTYEALMKLDFVAVSEIFMTPTAALADIVLPAATTFEFDDIGHYGLGHGYVLARPKVVEPPGECWPDLKILNELGKAVTPPEHWHEDWRALLEDVLKPGGLSYDQFAERGSLRGPEQFRKYLSGGFKTPTGKVELHLSQAEKFGLSSLPQSTGLPDEEDPDYPLVLTSCKSRFFLHSSYRWLESLRRHRPHPKTEIHPEAAARHGISDGDEILIETKAGAIVQVAHVTDRVHPRVVNAAYGWWFPEAGVESLFDWDRSNFNMLTTAERLGKAFGTPNLKGIGCRISKKENPKSEIRNPKHT